MEINEFEDMLLLRKRCKALGVALHMSIDQREIRGLPTKETRRQNSGRKLVPLLISDPASS